MQKENIVVKEVPSITSPLVGEEARRTGEGYKKGFTLIELLVVVLIIGILAAIAVPQYQKATEKSEEANMLTMLQSVTQAAQRFYLANGTYATSFAQLDINFPTTPGNCSRDSSFDDAVIHVDDFCIALVNFPRSVRISKGGWSRWGANKAIAYILTQGINGWTVYVKGLYCITGSAAEVGQHCRGQIKYNNAFGKYYNFE